MSQVAVVPLKAVVPPEPNEAIIILLEGMLEKAREGKLNYVGVAASYRDQGAVTTCWAAEGGAHRFTVLGAIHALALEWHNEITASDG